MTFIAWLFVHPESTFRAPLVRVQAADNELDDDFLNDLRDSDSDDLDEPTQGEVESGRGESELNQGPKSDKPASDPVPSAGHAASSQGGVSELSAPKSAAVASSASAAELYGDAARLGKDSMYQRQLNEVRQKLADSSPIQGISVPLELDPQYRTMLRCNEHMHEADDEIIRLHRFVATQYAKKFPELEQIVPDIVKYTRVVRMIGNATDVTELDMASVLPQSQVMVVTVTASTTSGQALPAADLQMVLQACSAVEQRLQEKADWLNYIQRFMHVVAPNVTAILGHSLAAQLVGLAGGLVALTRIPACNVQVLGQERKALTGLGSRSTQLHRGIVYGCPVVENAPPDLRVKASKLIAAKVVLAARVDSMQGSPDGAAGERFLEDVQAALEKAQEPPPNRTVKPLKRPDDKPSRKRGGRRYRALKDRLGLTAVRKAANRMSTSESAAEYGDVAMGQDRGMLNQDEGAGIRVAAKKQNLTKRRRVDSGGGGGNGLASTIAFTPVQGMEMVNPEAAAERVHEANAKYFGAGGFAKVKRSN